MSFFRRTIIIYSLMNGKIAKSSEAVNQINNCIDVSHILYKYGNGKKNYSQVEKLYNSYVTDE